jgi:hypothetical protein
MKNIAEIEELVDEIYQDKLQVFFIPIIFLDGLFQRENG